MKSPFKSKTVWINLLSLSIGLAAVFGASDLMKDYPDVVLGITSILIPSLNVFLRFLTSQPISIHPEKKETNA